MTDHTRAPEPTTYGEPTRYARQREVLARSWSYLGDVPSLDGASAAPATLLDGSLSEPLMVTQDRGRLRVLSNACTHRGALLLSAPCQLPSIRCPYHGRRFRLDGTLVAAPGLDPVPNEPLPEIPHAELGPLLFAALAPQLPFRAMLAPVMDRLAFLEFQSLQPDPTSARAYTIEAHWALWCDNYLEGYHIPFAHPDLARTLDLNRYTVETFDYVALQTGEARADEPAFELPAGHPDSGRRIGGYYLFLFPLTALNFYPWGLSLNAVQPLGPHRTRIVYRNYTWRPELRDRGAGANLDVVEREDDALIERVAAGVRSYLYRPGTMSSIHERAVSWFHDRLRTAEASS